MGNGPTISAMISLNLAGRTGLVSMGGMMVFFGLQVLHGRHLLTYDDISDFISGQ